MSIMKYKNLTFLLLIAIITFGVFGCSDHRGFKKTDDGLFYKIHVKGDDTTTIKIGDIITLDLKYFINDSMIFDSKNQPGEYMVQQMQPTYKGDIFSGFALLHPGDSATFISSVDSFFLKTVRTPFLPDSTWKGKEVTFNVKIVSVKSEAQMREEYRVKMEAAKAEEPITIDTFLKNNNITVTPQPSGLYFLETKKGSGQKPKVGDYGKVHLIVKNLAGDILHSSYDRGEPLLWEMGKDFDTKGVTEALTLMSKGSKATIVVPSALAFGEQGRGSLVPPYTPLTYELEMTDVVTKAQYEQELEAKRKAAAAEKEAAKIAEPSKIQNYLKANKITTAPTASGLYYVEIKKGTGEQAATGKKVKVHYTGTLIDGTKFDSSLDRNEPLEFTLGEGRVIEGWEEGIALMKEGGKAKLIIPSKLGYGENGSSPVIPPSAPLIFEVELIDVQ